MLPVFSLRSCSRILARAPSSVKRLRRVSSGSRVCREMICSSRSTSSSLTSTFSAAAILSRMRVAFTSASRPNCAGLRAAARNRACACLQCACPAPQERADRDRGVRRSVSERAIREQGIDNARQQRFDELVARLSPASRRSLSFARCSRSLCLEVFDALVLA